MFSLPDGWDDLGDDEHAGRGGSFFGAAAIARHRLGSSAASFNHVGATSKAAELLRRASEASRANIEGDVEDRGGEVDIVMPAVVATAMEPSAVPDAQDGVGDKIISMTADGDRGTEFIQSGAFAMEGCINSSVDSALKSWTSKGPEMLNISASSFRIGFRKGLIALPMRSSTSAGTFRVQLLRISPARLRPRGTAGTDRARVTTVAGTETEDEQAAYKTNQEGVKLLEAQMEAGFATPDIKDVTSSSAGIPHQLVPQCRVARELLPRYRESSSDSLGTRAQEIFELLDTLFGGSRAACSVPGKWPPEKWPPEDAQSMRHVAHLVSMWLAKVNSRVVNRHMQRSANAAKQVPRFLDLGLWQTGTGKGSKEPKTAEVAAAAAESRLKAAYHYLTANSVRRALRELNAAAADYNFNGGDTLAMAVDHGLPAFQFERLAAIVAACGGSSASRVELRRALRGQLFVWRSQGVPELMGSALWRIYSLLAGDLEEMVADSLEWHTAFGMYLWYGLPREGDEDPVHGKKNELLETVRDFEAIAKRHGSRCCFRPVPPYALTETSSGNRLWDSRQALPAAAQSRITFSSPPSEPYDLQFNCIRMVVGDVDWQDLSNFDYLTHSPQPLDVACSWHFSVLLMSILGGDLSKKKFQILTQQYCLILELSGLWEWAIYVALFVCDERARGLLIRGLLVRHAMVPTSNLGPSSRRQWPGIPEEWLRRAEALRCEALLDWPAAVSCWLHSGSDAAERALAIAAAFLQRPAILRHAEAPFQRGPTEIISLAPPRPEARWLIKVLQKLKSSMAGINEKVWLELGKELLSFMESWSEASTGHHYAHKTPAELARLCSHCDSARRHLLSLPK